MADRCPTCYRELDDATTDTSTQPDIFQDALRSRRSLRETISQTIALFGGIAVGVVIGRRSVESMQTLIIGCIGFAVFSIIIQTVSHKWIYRRSR